MKRVLRFWWAGGVKTMSPNRYESYRSIIRNSKVKSIEMITPENYKSYEVDGYPIHHAFQYLSDVHKSDYMRAYVGYHHGGGWTDVKYCDIDWNIYFDILENNPDKIGIGAKQMVIDSITGEYRVYFEYGYEFCAMSMWIFRAKTEVFKQYINEIDSQLDSVADELKLFPGNVHPLICSDGAFVHKENLPENLHSYKYPIKWVGLSTLFFFPQIPHMDKIIFEMPPPHNHLTGHPHR